MREAGTPAATSASTHSSTVLERNAPSSSGRSASRCSLRPAIVANRSSSSRSARPITSQSRSQKTCFAAPTTNQPSDASKFWNGTMVGCAELWRRGGTKPWVAAHGPMYISSCSAVSNSETSQSHPTPSRRARQIPASRAIAEA